jgi:hypothetical protein
VSARPFELHRDHRFESVPYSAYLVPPPQLLELATVADGI